MMIQTENAVYEFEDGLLTEKDKQTGRVREIGRGEILGFGVFTGLSDEEEPSIMSQEPKKGLQLFFKETGSDLPFDFVSEPLV